ncbi:MAG TPA: CotH kinase family protein [bacterium]|nr:CotH kinase family protein [bacterium]
MNSLYNVRFASAMIRVIRYPFRRPYKDRTLFKHTSIVCFLLSVAAPTPAQVVINEILYHPASDDSNEEFIELVNISDSTVDLTRWFFMEGIQFAFPSETTIPPQGYLIVARNRAKFLETYGTVPCPVLGDFSGQLSNAGELIVLVASNRRVHDRVRYSDQWPWNPDADGSGRSLECIAPTSPNDHYRNWQPSALNDDSRYGTPGRRNSAAQPNVPPLIAGVFHEPLVPSASESVRVIASVEDIRPFSVTLFFDTGDGYTSWPMFDDGMWPDTAVGDGRYTAVVPAQPAGTLVRYYVEVTGWESAVRRFPPEAPLYGRGWRVPNPENKSPLAHNEILLDPLELKGLINFPYDLSREAYGSYITDGVLYDNVRIRLRGGAARDFPKKNWRLDFPKSHLFDDAQRRLNFNCDYHDVSHMRNVLSMELLARLGLPTAKTQYMRLHFNGEYYGLYYCLEQINEDWLVRVGKDPDADLYKCYHDHTIPESSSDYPILYEKKAGEDQEDYTTIRQFVENLNAQPPAENSNYLESVFDVDSLLNYMVARALLSNADDQRKNHFLLLDGAWQIIPHDWDLSWGHLWDEELGLLNRKFILDSPSFFNVRTNRIMGAIRDNPILRARYYERLAAALQDVFREDIWWPRIEEIHQQIRQAVFDDPRKWEDNEIFDLQRQELRDYVTLRRKYLLEVEIPMGYPPTPTPIPTPRPTPPWNAQVVELADLSQQPVNGFHAGVEVDFGAVPQDHAYPNATDGNGMIVTLNPGDGAFFLLKDPIDISQGLVELSVAVRSTGGAIHMGLVAFADPFDGSYGYVNPTKREIPVDQWGKLRFVYDPPTSRILPALQLVVPLETASEPITVYMDNWWVAPFSSSVEIPIEMESDGSFDSIDSTLSGLNPNFLVPEGETAGEVSLTSGFAGQGVRLQLDPHELAANVVLFSMRPDFPAMVHGSMLVKRESGEEGTFGFVITDGEQSVGYFLNISRLPLNEFKMIQMGGNFEIAGKALSPMAAVQLGGPNVSGSLVIDRLRLFATD